MTQSHPHSAPPATFANVEELATYLNLSKPATLEALWQGRLPGRRLGRRWIVSRTAIDEWLRGDAPSPLPKPEA